MIWATAKLTEVSSRQIARPSRLRGSGRPRATARSAAMVAMTTPSRRRRRRSRAAGRRPAGGRCDGGRRGGSGGRERAVEVGHQVLEVLEPDRAAQQAGPDPGLLELRGVVLAMRRRRRVGDDRVDAPERGGPLRHGQGVDERAARGPAADRSAAELEGEHPARMGELARGDGVLWVARQLRVADALDARLRLEPRGQRPCSRGVAGHPDRQRRQPAQDEERGERGERRPGVDLDRLDLGDPGARSGDRAAERVGVPAQVLRQRLDR